jgi:hypothetical protein
MERSVALTRPGTLSIVVLSYLPLMMLQFLSKNHDILAKFRQEVYTTSRQGWSQLRKCEELALHGSRYERIDWPIIGLLGLKAQSHLRLGYLNIKMVPNYHLILKNRPPNRRTRWQFQHILLWRSRTIQPRRLAQRSLADPFTFLPFSARSRNCIGQHLANLMIKVVLMMILTQFKL